MYVIYTVIVADADKHTTYMHSPCTVTAAGGILVAGKITPKVNGLFLPFLWSMSIGVMCSLIFLY